jgi:hypothetical protein
MDVLLLRAYACAGMFTESLPSNGYTRHIAPSLRIFIPNSLQAYRHFFFSEGCACDVCVIGLTFLPVARMFAVFTLPTAPAAPSLRPLVPSGSLLRYHSVQVYHHHPVFPTGGAKLPIVAGTPTFSALTPCAVCFFRSGGGRPLHNV